MLVEGYARLSWRELRQACNVAIASAAEVQNIMYTVLDLGLCTSEEFNGIYDQAALFQRMAKRLVISDRQNPANSGRSDT